MVLVALGYTDGLPGAVVKDELLDAVRKPDVEEADAGHDCKPMCSVGDVAGAVVPVEGKHRTYRSTPLKRLIGGLELENSLKLKCIIFATFVLRVIIEKVLLGWLVMFNIFSSELMDLGDSLSILASSFIESFGVVSLIDFIFI